MPKDFHDRTGASSLPTGTVTLLLADIEGSTRMWETQADEMAAALAAMDRTLAELVHANNGVCPIEQGEGDSFVVAFSRASDAVACALAAATGCPVAHPPADRRSHRRSTGCVIKASTWGRRSTVPPGCASSGTAARRGVGHDLRSRSRVCCLSRRG